ncbi:Uncharacterised protein [Candidatus Anstonella stagnisolia]|nr:Uncharacterised protein [Candidatus Anstonella stagnisolia]
MPVAVERDAWRLYPYARAGGVQVVVERERAAGRCEVAASEVAGGIGRIVAAVKVPKGAAEAGFGEGDVVAAFSEAVAVVVVYPVGRSSRVEVTLRFPRVGCVVLVACAEVFYPEDRVRDVVPVKLVVCACRVQVNGVYCERA